MNYRYILIASLLLTSSLGMAQQAPKQPVTDSWSNVPPARDDRYTNPKSPLYSGPNGWYNFGEVRAQVNNDAKTPYAYKGGFQVIQGLLTSFTSDRLYVLQLDFGVDNPPPGTYQLASKGNAAQKQVRVSFGDVSGQKIKEWTGEKGTVDVSQVNKFLHVKCRNLLLQPTGPNNTDAFKAPMALGFEGAVVPE
ncbi:hypothetical protein ACAW74_00230 [Fibrella sp. WM1]|uniref:hypothetical protein n=1 Tax=Fibrella musci TaxID=3242485 RepID=UPI0035200336